MQKILHLHAENSSQVFGRLQSLMKQAKIVANSSPPHQTSTQVEVGLTITAFPCPFLAKPYPCLFTLLMF